MACESRCELTTQSEEGGRAMNTHVDELIVYPQRHFTSPDDVLTEPTLTVDQKRRILESWKLDAQRLAESTAENMTGGEETDLREVSKVLIQLKTMEDPPVAHTPKGSAGVASAWPLAPLSARALAWCISAATVPSVVLVAQASVVGLIVGGVVAVVRKALR